MTIRIIAGQFKNKSLKSPPSTTRPSSNKLRQSLFNICQNYIDNSAFLDLFAGSGAMGLEALSRGASFACFVENDINALRCIKENINTLGFQNKTKVIKGNVLSVLKKENSDLQYDIIFIDPPYILYEKSKDFIYEILSAIIETKLIKEKGLIFFEKPFVQNEKILEFKELEFISTRRLGTAALYEYRKI